MSLPDRIETDRLVLRTWRAGDAEALGAAITESLEHLRPWMPWASLEPVPVGDRRRLIAEWDRKFRAGEDVVYGVFHDGAVVGGSGFHRRIGPGGLEIGYWIHARYTRRGFATELSGALTDVAFTIDGIDRVEIHHDRENAASGGVPRALGYTFVTEMGVEAVAPSESGVQCVWRATRADWLARPTTT